MIYVKNDLQIEFYDKDRREILEKINVEHALK